MTNTKPEALRLADELESEWFADYDIQNAAAELRRLHEVNQELLEALKAILENDGGIGSKCFNAIRLFDARDRAQAAIAKAEVTK
jgi:hypothetical protein